jgi:hypothetical protein
MRAVNKAQRMGSALSFCAERSEVAESREKESKGKKEARKK